MIRSLVRILGLSVFLAILFPSLTMSPSVVHAGGTIKIDDTHSISIGVGLRTSFDMIKDGAPDGTSRSKDFKLDDARLYVSGQLHELITFEFNTETQQTGPTTATESIRVLDAVVKFGFNDYINVWMGRFLPPSDRSNLSGPFYLNAWNFPFVQQYPQIFAGRDDGAAIWGMVGKGMFKYQFGAFQGEGAVPGGPNQKDDLLYAGRLTLNLWDPEPGYYNSSTYYGAMNVLALGLVAMTQKDAVGTPADPGTFTGWSADLLVERNLGSIGVPTLEGAYYHYDNDHKVPQGKGFFVLVSYLLPMKIGTPSFQGQLQPMVRYEKFENNGLTTGNNDQIDVGLSYIINGHNARITANYFKDKDKTSTTTLDINGFQLGLQFQL